MKYKLNSSNLQQLHLHSMAFPLLISMHVQVLQRSFTYVHFSSFKPVDLKCPLVASYWLLVLPAVE